jgi:predicted nucleotidyltransferase
MLTENDIVQIARRIIHGYAPIALGTFGSYATSTARDTSDLDLVVIKETPEHPAVRAPCAEFFLACFIH